MINEGHRKLEAGGIRKPIERHIRQHEAIRDRCEQIFAVELNPEIEIGTLVTFSGAPDAVGRSELTSRLRSDFLGNGSVEDDDGSTQN